MTTTWEFDVTQGANPIDEILVSTNSFPVTPFDESLRFNPSVYRDLLDFIAEGRPAAIFTGCGTGEFWSLTEQERVEIAKTALEHVGGRIPVCVGWAHFGPDSAANLNRILDAGASGVLLMAPDPWPWDATGLRDYIHGMCTQIDLPVVVYVKSHAGLSPQWWKETATSIGVAGIKDGTGDADFVQGLLSAGYPATRIINGTPTAEWYSSTYWGLGITGYSSAVMNFTPALARLFRERLEQRDRAAVEAIHREFFWPIRKLRARSPSYTVTFVKSAVAMRGIPVGASRPPLGWPDEESLGDIRALVDRAADLVDRFG